MRSVHEIKLSLSLSLQCSHLPLAQDGGVRPINIFNTKPILPCPAVGQVAGIRLGLPGQARVAGGHVRAADSVEAELDPVVAQRQRGIVLELLQVRQPIRDQVSQGLEN